MTFYLIHGHFELEWLHLGSNKGEKEWNSEARIVEALKSLPVHSLSQRRRLSLGACQIQKV
jgi:hypothetical protein